jgi:hypothetical protein
VKPAGTRAIVLLLLGCAGGVQEPARSASPAASIPPAAVVAPPGPTPEQLADAEADRTIATALELVSRVRELAIESKVPGRRLDRKALHAEVARMLAEETPPQAEVGNTELLFALDTVPATFDLRATLALLYGSELAGFYDPKLGRMVLATDLGKDAEAITLYHELVHALQDQHFHLGKAFDWRPNEGDLQAALHALAEGDATSAMMDVFAEARGTPKVGLSPGLLGMDALLMQASPELQAVPLVMARSLMAPYVDGLRFVTHLREKSGGWPAVDRAFAIRPISTEHILHPEKYLVYEPVVAVEPPGAPPGFPDSEFRDVIGEQGLRILFEDWAPAEEAARAASDWGGDRVAFFTDGSQRLVRWHLAFDTDAAAERAFVLLARGALRAELPLEPTPDARLRPFVPAAEAKARARKGSLCAERDQRGPFAAVRRGRHIGVTLGPYRRPVTTVRQSDECPGALKLATELALQH